VVEAFSAQGADEEQAIMLALVGAVMSRSPAGNVLLGDGDRVLGTHTHERGDHGPVRPVQARTWVGAAQDGDLVTQHEQLDVLGGGRAGHQQDQPEHLPDNQVQQPQRHTRRVPELADGV
jgi:hypothetical protein